jgi:uncharacterized protein YprB with RNaseH-like and TPR domain
VRNRLTDLETVGLEQAKEWVEAEPIAAPANYKDPDKIAAYIKEAEEERVQRFALNADTCRIVALGYHDIGEGDPIVALFRTEDEERDGLTWYWQSYRKRATRVIGFNSLRFDLPVLVMRSIYLGVPYPEITLAPAWRSPHVDLYERLTLGGARDKKDIKGLKFYARRFGIPVYDDVSGKDVARLIAAGDYDTVRNHCLFDLDLTRALAERLGVLEAVAA